MKAIGILHHPKIPASQSLSADIARWIEEQGYEVWQCSGWDEEAVRARVPQLDLLITLGGDGTILRAARIGAPHQVRILGINMGRLGFLAEVQPAQWQERLKEVLEGNYWLEKRMMLRAELWRSGECVETYVALNDVVISRGSLARVIRLGAHIEGHYLTTYQGDGLIVSTPTGCTAYALACGGPILPPELRSILLVPIAPHLSLDRAIVLAEGVTVSICVSTDHVAILTIDGQSMMELAHDDRIVAQGSPHSGLFVRTRSRAYFYKTLMERLGNPYQTGGVEDG